jgi:hypothetical protein
MLDSPAVFNQIVLIGLWFVDYSAGLEVSSAIPGVDDTGDSINPTTGIVISASDADAAEAPDSGISAAQIVISTDNNDNVENMVTNAQPQPAATKAGTGSMKLPLNLKAASNDREKSAPFKSSEQRKKSARSSSVQDDKEKKMLKPEEVSLWNRIQACTIDFLNNVPISFRKQDRLLPIALR